MLIDVPFSPYFMDELGLAYFPVKKNYSSTAEAINDLLRTWAAKFNLGLTQENIDNQVSHQDVLDVDFKMAFFNGIAVRNNDKERKFLSYRLNYTSYPSGKPRPDNDSSYVKVDKEVWENILGDARKKLTDLLGGDLESALIDFIPFLIDESFAKLFAQKLSRQVNDADVIKKVNYLIGVCFQGKAFSKELNRIVQLLEKYQVHDYLKQVVELNQATNRYKQYLEEKIAKKGKNSAADTKKYNALKELEDMKFSLQIKENKFLLNSFAIGFKGKQEIFKAGADSKELRLLKNIAHILASLTVVYAIGMAAYSYKTRGSAKFWKSSDEIFQDKVAAIEMKLRK